MKKIILLSIFLVLTSCSSDENGNVTVVPISPTLLNGVLVSNNQVNLTWTDNSTNEEGFKIERKTSSGNFSQIASVNSDITTFSDFNLSTDTDYTYRVYAFNAVGNSLTYSNEFTITTGSSIDVSSGLIAFYPFDGNANDLSGNNNTGTVNGATLSTDRFGNTNSCYSFNGTTDFIKVNNSSSLNSSSISISGWFNTNNLPNGVQGNARAIISKWLQQSGCNIDAENYIVELATISNSARLVCATKFYNQTSFFSQNQIINTNTWYHFAFIHDEQTGGKLYINGVLISSNSLLGSKCSTTNSLYIGADNLGNSLWRFFNGKIDDIRIYNIALTQQQISYLATH
ncbi:LamG-like jellyroll fold domain-containing protein [Flavobacterium sp. RSB2_4_14]|uniref:LamG domain-containing protein n=1 Tax=Flavobacterium sp. RSB2_4_14 TaxID=3447665 RepID=UPI003F2D795D